MAEPINRGRSRAARTLKWLLVSVALALLAYGGHVVWVFSGMTVDNGEAHEEALDSVRDSADRTSQRLLRVARRNEPTEARVRTIILQSSATVMRVEAGRAHRVEALAELYASIAVGWGSAVESRCYRFVLTGTGSPAAEVRTVELDECPDG